MASDHIGSHIETDPVYSQALRKSAVLIIGSWSFGLGDKYSDLDLLLLIPDEEYVLLSSELSRTARFTVAHSPMLMASRIRSISEFLRSADLSISWFIIKNAFCLEDRNGAFTQLHARTSQMFFAELPSLRLRTLALFRRQLDWIRFSVDRDLGVSYQLLKSEFIQYYFQLIFLYDDEPYAYTKWMKPLLKRLPSYALFPPNLEREISSFLLKATAREALSHADNLVEVLFNRLRRAGKCHQPDLLDVDSDAYYSLLP